MSTLLGDLTSWIDSKKRIAADRVSTLLSDPATLAGRVPSDLNRQFGPMIDAAIQGDTAGIINSGLLGPLTFAGVKAKTANLPALRDAMKMAKEGVSREKILQETGWFRGADKKWKFEIPDVQASTTPSSEWHPRNIRRMDKAEEYPFREPAGYVTEFVKHPELFKAYPQLESTWMKVTPERGDYGAFFPPTNEWPAGRISVGLDFADPMATQAHRTTALHELEHAIQNIEGFGQGGNTSSAVMHPKVKPWSGSQLRMGEDIISPHEAYMRLAGEAESRAVERRSMFTLPELFQNPPWTSYDRPWEKLLVQYKDPLK